MIRRIGSWIVWWALLMAFWVLLDDSLALAELLSGAAVAAMASFLVELLSHQADARLRIRVEWLQPALRLPVDLARDTILVLAVLWRRLVHGEQPNSGFRVLPVPFGDDSPEGVTRRVLLVGGRSVAPNTFVLGLDRETALMVVHQLVVDHGAPLGAEWP
ncbi:MAG: Na+/H+ antiporter subunit E [Acidimicrobiales bacterium]